MTDEGGIPPNWRPGPTSDFDMAFNKWYASRDGVPLLRDAANWGYAHARANEPEVAKLVELSGSLLDECASVNWSNPSHAPTVMRNLEEALAAYAARQGGKV